MSLLYVVEDLVGTPVIPEDCVEADALTNLLLYLFVTLIYRNSKWGTCKNKVPNNFQSQIRVKQQNMQLMFPVELWLMCSWMHALLNHKACEYSQLGFEWHHLALITFVDSNLQVWKLIVILY